MSLTINNDFHSSMSLTINNDFPSSMAINNHKRVQDFLCQSNLKKRSQTHRHVGDLPLEIILNIFKYLKFRDILAIDSTEQNAAAHLDSYWSSRRTSYWNMASYEKYPSKWHVYLTVMIRKYFLKDRPISRDVVPVNIDALERKYSGVMQRFPKIGNVIQDDFNSILKIESSNNFLMENYLQFQEGELLLEVYKHYRFLSYNNHATDYNFHVSWILNYLGVIGNRHSVMHMALDFLREYVLPVLLFNQFCTTSKDDQLLLKEYCRKINKFETSKNFEIFLQELSPTLQRILLPIYDLQLMKVMDLENDFATGLFLVSQGGSRIRYLNLDLQNHPDIIYQAVKNSSYLFEQYGYEKNFEIVLNAVSIDGKELSLAPHFNDNEKIVKQAIRSSHKGFGYASIRLQSNFEMIRYYYFYTELKTKEIPELSVMVETLKNNPSWIEEIISINGFVIEHGTEEMRNSFEWVLDAVSVTGLALQFASADLKNNFEIVLEAVVQDGMALEFASQELKNNREIALEAVKQNGLSLQFVSDDLRNNIEIVLEALKQNGMALKFVPENLKENMSVFHTALQQNGKAFKYLPVHLRRELWILMLAMKQNYKAYNYHTLVNESGNPQLTENFQLYADRRRFFSSKELWEVDAR